MCWPRHRFLPNPTPCRKADTLTKKCQLAGAKPRPVVRRPLVLTLPWPAAGMAPATLPLALHFVLQRPPTSKWARSQFGMNLDQLGLWGRKGLPPPNADEYPDDAGDVHYKDSYLAVSAKEVRENFELYGLLDDDVVFLEGWFKDTLPNVSSECFSIIRLDGDMYESTWDALTNLYPSLSPGGFCIIDDYMLPNCRKAVIDYREKHDITCPIEKIDNCAVYWRKSR